MSTFTLKDNATGKIYPSCTFEVVGACDPRTLDRAIGQIEKYGLPCRRIVSIVGLNELIEKDFIDPMLTMVKEAGMRLIVPPISPILEMYKGQLEARWNYQPKREKWQGSWLGMGMDDETLAAAFLLVEHFFQDCWTVRSMLDKHFGILATDLALIELMRERGLDVFTKLSVLAGTRNTYGVRAAGKAGANSTNLIPMHVQQVEAIQKAFLDAGEDTPRLDVYIDPPDSIRPSWYEFDRVISRAPDFIKAGARVLKVEGVRVLEQLLDDYCLLGEAIPRQTAAMEQTMDRLNSDPYETIIEPGDVSGGK